jgi:hypothetical protein
VYTHDIKAQGIEPTQGVAKMLLALSGMEQANKAMVLNLTVDLVQGFNVELAFGASGTSPRWPSARQRC